MAFKDTGRWQEQLCDTSNHRISGGSSNGHRQTRALVIDDRGLEAQLYHHFHSKSWIAFWMDIDRPTAEKVAMVHSLAWPGARRWDGLASQTS